MIRTLILALLCALPCGSFAAVCYAQTLTNTPSSTQSAIAPGAAPPASSPAPASSTPSNNPINLLWSALGSSPIAALLYSLLRGEQTERRQISQKMLDSFVADAEHKTTLRERLKGQDDALARMADLLKSVDQRLARNPLPPRPSGGEGSAA